MYLHSQRHDALMSVITQILQALTLDPRKGPRRFALAQTGQFLDCIRFLRMIAYLGDLEIGSMNESPTCR